MPNGVLISSSTTGAPIARLKKSAAVNDSKSHIILMKTDYRGKIGIIYNLCQYGMGNVWKWGGEVGGNCWRTTGDLGIATNLYNNWRLTVSLRMAKRNGQDPGTGTTLIICCSAGLVGKGAATDPAFTKRAVHAYVAVVPFGTPLIFSGDMTKLDEFTLSILTNDEVIEVDQDPLGRQASASHIIYGQRIWKTAQRRSDFSIPATSQTPSK